jgi:acyl-CoA synthetase (AMP-forming)/AMP-acid ligase II
MQPGEVHVRTPSLFRGYWGAEGFRTLSFTADGWHATGDYGFLCDGEVYIIGRIKDVIIVGGQNVHPEDVESLVNDIDGVYKGRVVAFGIDDESSGTQSLAVVAEMTGSGETAAIGREIRQAIVSGLGVAPRHVAVVPERWIVKSTAGKISRQDTRERFVRERLSLDNADSEV